ncbi:MAG: bifunctional adenosylcobinamide kinase/adenosylcobinamide-phosphate guanylyltransferase [Halanaerobiales bacterium]|nr:bifunctional adenosylcobinamide kinase/adenosylcobinamide-phosphate guanylyltransferase [Halanaerobiales bacterium]
MITLVLGGARSGKSSFAQQIAWQRGGYDVIYLATALSGDEEMAARIKDHRQNRPIEWKTIEEPLQVSKIFSALPPGQVVVLDCLTILISNILLREAEAGPTDFDFAATGNEKEVFLEIEMMLKHSREKKLDLIMVSNEVGQSLVPTYRLGRLYRDVVGRANQLLAGVAGQVYLLYAGLPVEIKELAQKHLEQYHNGGDE